MSDWKTIPVRELIEPVKSWNPLRANPDDLFDYIDLSAVDQATKAIIGAREITCGEAPSRARQLVSTGDILVSTVRPNLNGIAKVNAEFDGATASTGFCVLRPRPNLLDSNYLFHWVKSPQFVADMVSKATGASYPAVSDRIIFDSPIAVPSFSEQRRIAAILEQADALRTKRREALVQLDSLTQSIFIEMFGEQLSLSLESRKVRLDSLVEVNPRFTQTDRSKIRTHISFVPMASINEVEKRITENFLRPYAEVAKGYTPFKRGDVLVAKITPCYENGKMAIASELETELAFGSTEFHVFHASTSEMAFFVFHFLQLKWVAEAGARSMKGAGGQKRVPAEFFKSLEVTLPSPAHQKIFAARIQAIESIKEAHRATLIELDALFASLQHRAFQGNL